MKKMMLLSRTSNKMIKEHIESRGEEVLWLLRGKRWLISRKDMDKIGEGEKDIWGVIQKIERTSGLVLGGEGFTYRMKG